MDKTEAVPGIAALSDLDGQSMTRWLRDRLADRWIFPANLTHTLIGLPGSPDDMKTFVEPGGAFSPGVGTYGLTFWVYDRRQRMLYAPETYRLDDLTLTLEGGYLPIVNSTWQAGDVTITCQICASGHDETQHVINDYAQITLSTTAETTQDMYLYVAVRSLGPAGGPVTHVGYNDARQTIYVNGAAAVQLDQAAEAFGACAFGEVEDDISQWARRGELPATRDAQDSLGLASGAGRLAVQLQAGQEWTLGIRAAVKRELADDHLRPGDVANAIEATKAWWRGMLDTVDLALPGAFSRDVFKASIGYLLNLTVNDEVHVSCTSYPNTYLRDGVYMINAIDKAGLHDHAQRYIEYLIAHPWAGAASQQGPEADAPGELLWIVSEHYRLTGDTAWLRAVYPAIRPVAELLSFLRNPIDGTVREFAGVTLTVTGNEVFAMMDTTLREMPLHFDVLLARVEDGIIFGRIDLAHTPHWLVMPMTIAGLTGMAEAAAAIGENEDTARFGAEAHAAQQAYDRYCRTDIPPGWNSVVIWPCRSLDTTLPYLSDLHKPDSYAQHLIPVSREFDPELALSNKYINFGAAHNLLLLGHRNEAIAGLAALYNSSLYHESLQAHAYAEVTKAKEERWYEVRHWRALWSHVRGWFNLGFNLPHGWCSAELALLLRDMVAYEEDGWLRLGEGIMPRLLAEGEPVGCRRLPTYYGTLTYQLMREGETIRLELDDQISPPHGFTLYVGPDVTVRRRGPNRVEETVHSIDGRVAVAPGLTTLHLGENP